MEFLFKKLCSFGISVKSWPFLRIYVFGVGAVFVLPFFWHICWCSLFYDLPSSVLVLLSHKRLVIVDTNHDIWNERFSIDKRCMNLIWPNLVHLHFWIIKLTINWIWKLGLSSTWKGFSPKTWEIAPLLLSEVCCCCSCSCWLLRLGYGVQSPVIVSVIVWTFEVLIKFRFVRNTKWWIIFISNLIILIRCWPLIVLHDDSWRTINRYQSRWLSNSST